MSFLHGTTETDPVSVTSYSNEQGNGTFQNSNDFAALRNHVR